jgi:glycogen operon protein
MPLEHHTRRTVSKGRAYPLGATPTDRGVNFAIYSRYAAEVFLLLFDAPDGEPATVAARDRATRRGFVNHSSCT